MNCCECFITISSTMYKLTCCLCRSSYHSQCIDMSKNDVRKMTPEDMVVCKVHRILPI